MNKKIFLVPAILFFLLISVFFYLLLIDRDPSELPSMLINKEAPQFKAESLFDEQSIISNTEFGEEIVLVNFFATWCLPCRAEHQFIKKLSNEPGIKLIGINYKDKNEIAKKWLNEMGNPYSKVGVDKNGSIAIDWGLYGIPETYVVDKNGIVQYKYIGPITKKTYKQFYSKIKKLKK
tara:strand:+ start:93 stop:626 length:534 start_codon:yes stop_codon:yes gene_type:complete